MGISLRELFQQGGPGSGFKGHKGRDEQNLVGGSVPRDGSPSSLPSQEKILSEAERDYYWEQKRGAWVESPSNPRTQKDLSREDLLKMDPEETVTVKFYSGKRGGVSRKEVKVKQLLLNNEPKVSSLPTLSKAYPTMSSLISGLKAGKRDAEVSAKSLVDQVVSGSRLMASSGRLDKSKIKEINSLLRSLPDATSSLGGESSTNAFLIQRLEIAGQIYDIINVKRNRLFHQGGPGSGFRGHRGRPGEVGGSSKKGTVPSSGKEEQESLLGMGPKPDKRKKIKEIVQRLGYPVDKVHATEADGPTFMLNGKQLRTGADYTPTTGEIRIFGIDKKDDATIEGMLAHEIQHSRWNAFHEAYQEQFVEVTRSTRVSDDPKDWLINMDGSLKSPADKEKFWAYDINQSFIEYGSGGRRERLDKADGISAYSKQYWKQAKASGSAWDYDRAIDETLAEIARIETGNRWAGDKKAVRPIWKSLYTKVRKRTVKRNMRLFLFGSQGLFHFGGEGSGFHGHKGRIGMVGGSSSTLSIGDEVSSEDEFIKQYPYMYHITKKENTAIIATKGLKQSPTGYGGKGVYFARTPEETQYYSTLDDPNSRLFRVKSEDILRLHPFITSGGKTEYDDDTGEIIFKTSIPGELLEWQTTQGSWRRGVRGFK